MTTPEGRLTKRGGDVTVQRRAANLMTYVTCPPDGPTNCRGQTEAFGEVFAIQVSDSGD